MGVCIGLCADALQALGVVDGEEALPDECGVRGARHAPHGLELVGGVEGGNPQVTLILEFLVVGFEHTLDGGVQVGDVHALQRMYEEQYVLVHGLHQKQQPRVALVGAPQLHNRFALIKRGR